LLLYHKIYKQVIFHKNSFNSQTSATKIIDFFA